MSCLVEKNKKKQTFISHRFQLKFISYKKIPLSDLKIKRNLWESLFFLLLNTEMSFFFHLSASEFNLIHLVCIEVKAACLHDETLH